ncbi:MULTISPECIES: Dabb family protein [Actinosynnema]|uniref:Dabb family protein n=1 Tax=Actinosynnema TaxID=40566 RepID=UPI0020A4F24B|nr:Dabb family protein [Actinosynnema pretiosum]MCP2098204.1 Stress responsive A/B Barrel Domain [Actinosynnema pretiosum]
MIVNLLRFAFKQEATAQERAEVLAVLRGLTELEPVSFSSVGPDIGDDPRFTHAYCVALADFDALRRYVNDPAHLAADSVIIPRLARLSATRFADEGSPELAEAVNALHREKAAAHPEWARLLGTVPELDLAAG